MNYALIGIVITLVGYLIAFVAGYNKLLQEFKDHAGLDLKEFQSMEKLLTEKNSISLKYHESHFSSIKNIEIAQGEQREINRAKAETLSRMEGKMDKSDEKIDKLLEWILKHNKD